MPSQFNLQDAFLNGARKSKTPLTIHVTNGYQINSAVVVGYDSFVVLCECDGRQMMIYKHAISTMSPEKRIDVTPAKEQTNEEKAREE